ncbi:metallophosphoesterase family protein [Clostridium fungisolvens]|uniref:3',5'-cyclic adenosine monophosphate phosphodiesterase CpdA n=1 Tax=Clostridium fungisolvens TaxID=1604897 RepID=A0A6V8SK97_9CLOT|nr:metallophosphoesterase [Clostridium fungisolvens]GFP75323.1 3',5'-cyclic adenosine monophosphate phosphodiesterase CpdA [Clostridium fungisolvens]
MKEVKFAVFTDLHYDHIHDGQRRLKNFIADIQEKDIDFIVNLGDFCKATKNNNSLLDILNSTGRPYYNLIGNHDSDSCDREEVLRFFGMKDSYYSFKYGDIKFIALDTCFIQYDREYVPYCKKNYDSSAGIYPVLPEEELNWLKKELKEECPYFVILSHHSFENEFMKRGVHNRNEVQQLINDINKTEKRVLMCLNGHDHADSIRKIGDTYYFAVNAMSYIWFGPQYEHFTYSEDIHERYPFIKDLVLYEEGLYTIVTILPDGNIKIDGMEGCFQTVSPKELGIEGDWNGRAITARISSLNTDNNK